MKAHATTMFSGELFAKDVKCPHCGHKNTVKFASSYPGELTQKVTYCDPEDGGCEKRFVVYGHYEPCFVGSTHKITGLK